MAWAFLIAAGLCEVTFAYFLKASEGFSKTTPTILFFGFSVLSFYLLTKAMATIPLGTAYAVWTGIGALGTAIVGIIFFKDPATLARIFFLGLLLTSIVGLKLVSPR